MADLPSVGDLYGQEMQAIQGFGNQQQADLQQQYQNAMGMGMQSMAQSGLAGTSIAPSMRMGYMKQYSQALNRLNDQLTQTKLGAASTFGLGGIQAQQAGQQLANQQNLGQGNLDVNRGYLAVAQQQAAGQQGQMAAQQQQGYQWLPQGFQAGGGAGSYSALFS